MIGTFMMRRHKGNSAAKLAATCLSQRSTRYAPARHLSPHFLPFPTLSLLHRLPSRLRPFSSQTCLPLPDYFQHHANATLKTPESVFSSPRRLLQSAPKNIPLSPVPLLARKLSQIQPPPPCRPLPHHRRPPLRHYSPPRTLQVTCKDAAHCLKWVADEKHYVNFAVKFEILGNYLIGLQSNCRTCSVPLLASGKHRRETNTEHAVFLLLLLLLTGDLTVFRTSDILYQFNAGWL